ncbi:MAG: Na+/H+ antiporter NhaA [Hyphomicrobiaceae bacterium]|nr:Na+/H+ antiporter NhaA [Hyphomicrobiaceae bacterium]
MVADKMKPEPSDTGTGAANSFMRGARAFFDHQAAGGIVLMAAAVLAILLANSPLQWLYAGFNETPVAVRVGPLALEKPLLLWINDGLMAIFFFLVGLEIKKELLEGRLATFQSAALPAFAAVGGMLVPALIYVAINWNDPTALRGWAIPAATDIAFALGVLALLGPRVPAALKVFLLALAIIDDLGAVIIIALFYTSDLSMTALQLALAGVVGLALLNWFGVARLTPYVLVGIFLWVCVLKSGVHATLAGVVVALFIPMRDPADASHSPVKEVEHGLAPWVAFGIMPVFAFANAGVSLSGLSFADVFAGIPLGIALGLFIGKQIGIVGLSWLAVRAGIATLPEGLDWRHIYGASLLAGIGFTMSLFIGTLAFPDDSSAAAVRIGVLGGTLLSGVAGYFVLRAILDADAALPKKSAAAGTAQP